MLCFVNKGKEIHTYAAVVTSESKSILMIMQEGKTTIEISSTTNIDMLKKTLSEKFLYVEKISENDKDIIAQELCNSIVDSVIAVRSDELLMKKLANELSSALLDIQTKKKYITLFGGDGSELPMDRFSDYILGKIDRHGNAIEGNHVPREWEIDRLKS